jgi:hypothetical protein
VVEREPVTRALRPPPEVDLSRLAMEERRNLPRSRHRPERTTRRDLFHYRLRMAEATYVIDKKRAKSQGEYPGHDLKRVPIDVAVASIFDRRNWRPKPAADDAKDALAFLDRFFTDDAVRQQKPSLDELEALWGYGRHSMHRDAKLSLFLAWGGPEWLLSRALGGGRYAWDSPKGTLVVDDGRPLSNWDLEYAIAAVEEWGGLSREVLLAACKSAKLPLTDRSCMASLFDDAGWAGELVEEWIARGTSRQESWNNCMLLGLIDDADRFERFVASFGDQIRYIGRSARLGRALDRVPAPVLERVVVGLLDRGLKEKWKASDVEPWAKLLTHVKSAEAARAIAQWIAEKSVAKLATDYFRTHPDLANQALGALAKGKGKAAPIAKAILDSIARAPARAAAADAEDDVKPAKASKSAEKASKSAEKASKSTEKASKGTAKASKGTAKASKSSTEASPSLPSVLTDPPWQSKTPRVRPRVALELLVDRETFEPKVGGWTHRPAPNRGPETDARILGGRPPSELHESSAFGVTDAVALEALRDRGHVSRYHLDGMVAWLGEPLVPLAIRSIAVNLLEMHPMLSRAASSRLALPCARAAQKRSGGAERVAARAGIAEHPDDTALGLVPAALSEDDVEASIASDVLRSLVKSGHAALVARAASRYGAAAKAAIDDVLAASPYDRYPSKLPSKAKWALPAQIGTLEIEGGESLTEAQGTALVQMLQFSAIGDPYPGATDTIALATTSSRERMAKALFDEYLLAGSPPSHAWVLGAITWLAPVSSIALLASHMRAWAADGKVALLHDSLEALASIGSDEALVVVYDAGQRSRYDDTRDKVRAILESVAKERGVRYEVLEDMLVPELGLESGAVALDLGARRLAVRLGDHLDAVLTDDTGNTLAAFPRKAKSDDAAKYDAAKARFAALLEASEAVGKGQVLRLERALRAQRQWSVEELRTWVLPQPLVRHLACRLIWQVVGAGTLFRVAEDLSLADANDDTLAWPAAQARVVIAHPLRAPGLAAFQRWVDDYRVIQPFAQIGREVFSPTADERAKGRVERAVGRKAPYLSVLGLTLGMGWKPIPPGDKGIDAITRELPSGVAANGLVARLAISPGLLFGAAKGRPEQTLGVLTLANEAREPTSFDGLDALDASELLRDVLTL